MTQAVRGAFWTGMYLALVVVPLVFASLGVPPAGRTFWREFAVALGFVGLSMWGLEFVLVARFKGVAAPFGEDAIIQFHKLMGYFATLFVLAHPFVLIVAVNSRFLRFINPISAPWRFRWGAWSIILVLVLVVTSAARKQLRIKYEYWQAAHAVLATLAVATAVVHVELVHYYVASSWKRGLWAAMTAVFVGVILWVRVVRPFPAAAPPVGGRVRHPRARCDLDPHPAPGRAPGLHLRSRSVRLAQPQPLGVRVQPAPVLLLVER